MSDEPAPRWARRLAIALAVIAIAASVWMVLVVSRVATGTGPAP